MAYNRNPIDSRTLNALKTLPNSYEAEQAVLAAMIIDSEISDELVANLKSMDFYTNAHKVIFDEIADIKKKGKPVDIVMLSNSLSQKNSLQDIGGVSMLSGLVDSLPSVANYKYYYNIVKEKSLLRDIIRACNEIISNAYEVEEADRVLSFAESKIFDLSDKNANKSDLRHVSEIGMEVLQQYSEVYQSKVVKSGLKVGIDTLDEMTNGFLPGQMLVLAARPGCGKTSFCMHLICNIVREQNEKVVACFNLEMSDIELTQRLITNITQVETRKYQKGEITHSELDKLWKAGALFDKSNVYIDDSAFITSEQILSKCRKLKNQKGRLDFIIVDYLQLMSTMRTNESKQQQVSEMSRNIKILAKELKVPVLLLSQMSRSIEKRSIENPEDARPKLSDLRESGAIEQDADMVMFLTEGDFDLFNTEGVPIYLNIAKHRNGSIGDLAFRWNKSTMTYYPIRNIVKSVQNQESNADKMQNVQEKPKDMPKNQNQEAYDDYFYDNAPPSESFEEDIFGDIKGDINTKPMHKD